MSALEHARMLAELAARWERYASGRLEALHRARAIAAAHPFSADANERLRQARAVHDRWRVRAIEMRAEADRAALLAGGRE